MKVLLLTDIPPCKDFTAGLVLDQLCKFLPRDTLCCFAVVNPNLAVRMSPDFSGVPILFRAKPNENWSWLPAGKRSRYLSAAFIFAAERQTRRRYVAALVQEAIEFGRKQNVDRVWAVLQGQTTIRMAGQVARGLGVPLHTQVWDPFSWWATANRLDGRTTRQTLELFDETIRQSASCATASIPMAQEYKKRFGSRALPVFSSHDQSMAQKPDVAAGIGESLTIGMAGQFYAHEEWSRLIHALNCASWKVAGKPVRVIVLGPQEPPYPPPDQLEYLGWKSQPEAAEILARCDVLYCPYPFDPAMKEVSQFSFPSKLILYLAAGRPVLFHGPEYSAPSIYILENGVGTRCSQLAASAVYNELERLVVSPSLYADLARNAQNAFVNDFSLESMSRAFKSFINFGTDDEPLTLHDHRRQSGPEQPVELAVADRNSNSAVRGLRLARSVAAKHPVLKDIYLRGFSAPAIASMVSSKFRSGRAQVRHALKNHIRSLVLRIPRMNSLYHEIHSLYQQKSELLAAIELQISTSQERYLQLESHAQKQLQISADQLQTATERAANLEQQLRIHEGQLQIYAQTEEETKAAIARLEEENAELHYYLGNQLHTHSHQVNALPGEKEAGSNEPVYFADATEFADTARRAIIETDVVLDIGCGIRPQNFFRPRVHLCIEPYDEYVRVLRNKMVNHPSVIVLKLDALNALLQLPDRSVDSIFLLDVIEHLEKKAGLAVLRECQRVARRQIAVFTPLGFMPQEYGDDERDAWGLSGAELQVHLSGWLPEDFGEGWNFLICETYHQRQTQIAATQVGMPSQKSFGALWAIRTITDHRPKLKNRTLFIGRALPPAPAPSGGWVNLWEQLPTIDPTSYGCVTSFEFSPYSTHLQTSEARLSAPYSYISFSHLSLFDTSTHWESVEKTLPRTSIDRVIGVVKEGRYDVIYGIAIEAADAAFALFIGHKNSLPVTLLTLQGDELSNYPWFREYPGALRVLSPLEIDPTNFADKDMPWIITLLHPGPANE